MNGHLSQPKTGTIVKEKKLSAVVQFPAHRRAVEGGLFRLAFQDGDCIYQPAGSSPVRSTDNLIT